MSEVYKNEDFEEAYEEYREVAEDQIKLVSRFIRGEMNEDQMNREFAGMQIYKSQFEQTMEEKIFDMEEGVRMGLLDEEDIEEVKKRFSNITEITSGSDSLIEKVKEQHNVEKKKKIREQEIKNRNETRKNFRYFFALHNEGKELMHVLETIIENSTEVSDELENVKIADINLSKLKL